MLIVALLLCWLLIILHSWLLNSWLLNSWLLILDIWLVTKNDKRQMTALIIDYRTIIALFRIKYVVRGTFCFSHDYAFIIYPTVHFSHFLTLTFRSKRVTTYYFYFLLVNPQTATAHCATRNSQLATGRLVRDGRGPATSRPVAATSWQLVAG